MQSLKLDTALTPASPHLSQRNRGLRYSEVLRRTGLRNALRLFRENWVQRWCIWRDALRSCAGHIRTQSAIGHTAVGLGPHNHRTHRSVRTVARRLYTEKLLAIRPWADSQDLQTFLMGFDAGESWASCNTDTESRDQISVRSSWLTSENMAEINLTLDMLKRQWYKSQYESTRPTDPKQSGELLT